MSDSPVKRQGTMEVTAAEGTQYLKDNKKDTLLKAQGLDGAAASNGKTPTPTKTETMIETLKEGKELMKEMGGAPDDEAKTRAQQAAIDAAEDEGPTHAVEETIEEGKEFLGVPLKEMASTRSKTEQLHDAEKQSKKEDNAGPTHAVEETIEEAKEFLGGDLKAHDGLRSDDDKHSSPHKRTHAIEETIEEAQEIYGDDINKEKKDEDGPPAPKMTKTMEDTLEAGKEFVNGSSS